MTDCPVQATVSSVRAMMPLGLGKNKTKTFAFRLEEAALEDCEYGPTNKLSGLHDCVCLWSLSKINMIIKEASIKRNKQLEKCALHCGAFCSFDCRNKIEIYT